MKNDCGYTDIRVSCGSFTVRYVRLNEVGMNNEL